MNEEINILEATESVEPDEYGIFLKDDKWFGTDIKPYILDHADEYERPDFLFVKDGKPFAPLGSICSITGQPGHGKTTTFSIFMTAILKGSCCGIQYNLDSKYSIPKVLYIDTEMEKGNTQKVVRRIYKMCGFGRDQRDALKDQLYVLRLREVDDVQERWRIVLQAIYEVRPLAVFLDGFLDMVADFNDNKECLSAIYKHMSVSTKYECVLWDLVHQNPNSDKMVGHGGSFIQRKGADIFQTKKVKELGNVHFEVSHVKARGQDQDDWSYCMVDDKDYIGTPVLLDSEEAKEIFNEEAKRALIEDVRKHVEFIGPETVSYRSLRENMKKQFGIGSAKANNYITEAMKYGIIESPEINKYRMKIVVEGTDQSMFVNNSENDPF